MREGLKGELERWKSIDFAASFIVILMNDVRQEYSWMNEFSPIYLRHLFTHVQVTSFTSLGWYPVLRTRSIWPLAMQLASDRRWSSAFHFRLSRNLRPLLFEKCLVSYIRWNGVVITSPFGREMSKKSGIKQVFTYIHRIQPTSMDVDDASNVERKLFDVSLLLMLLLLLLRWNAVVTESFSNCAFHRRPRPIRINDVTAI